jgi:hypothetical protein
MCNYSLLTIQRIQSKKYIATVGRLRAKITFLKEINYRSIYKFLTFHIKLTQQANYEQLIILFQP